MIKRAWRMMFGRADVAAAAPPKPQQPRTLEDVIPQLHTAIITLGTFMNLADTEVLTEELKQFEQGGLDSLIIGTQRLSANAEKRHTDSSWLAQTPAEHLQHLMPSIYRLAVTNSMIAGYSTHDRHIRQYYSGNTPVMVSLVTLNTLFEEMRSVLDGGLKHYRERHTKDYNTAVTHVVNNVASDIVVLPRGIVSHSMGTELLSHELQDISVLANGVTKAMCSLNGFRKYSTEPILILGGMIGKVDEQYIRVNYGDATGDAESAARRLLEKMMIETRILQQAMMLYAPGNNVGMPAMQSHRAGTAHGAGYHAKP